MTTLPLLLLAAAASAQTSVDSSYKKQNQAVEYVTNDEKAVAENTFYAVQWILGRVAWPEGPNGRLGLMLNAGVATKKGKTIKMGYENVGDALRVLVEERPKSYEKFPRLAEPYAAAVKAYAAELVANREYSAYFKRVKAANPGKTDLEIAYWEIAAKMLRWTPGSTSDGKEGDDKDTGAVVAKKHILLPFRDGKVDLKTPAAENRPECRLDRLSAMLARDEDVVATKSGTIERRRGAIAADALVRVEAKQEGGARKCSVRPGREPSQWLTSQDTLNSTIAQSAYGQIFDLNTTQAGLPSKAPLGPDVGTFMSCADCQGASPRFFLVRVVRADPGVLPDTGGTRPRRVDIVRYAVDGATGEFDCDGGSPSPANTIWDDPSRTQHGATVVLNPYVIRGWAPGCLPKASP